MIHKLIRFLVKRFMPDYHIAKNPPKGTRKPRKRLEDAAEAHTYSPHISLSSPFASNIFPVGLEKEG